MTQKEKQLLLKDLCARLPYGVKCNALLKQIDESFKSVFGIFKGYNGWATIGNNLVDIETVKPYFRPMSSMTSQEWCELCDCNVEDEKAAIFIKDGRRFVSHVNQETFLNSHHFDYRGLIPLDLALEASEGMYKTE